MPADTEGLFYARLRQPPVNGTVTEIINRLSPNEKVDLCQQLDLCITDAYPFLFERRSSKKIKRKIGVQTPLKTMLRYLEYRPQIVLPKNIVVQDDVKEKDIFFGPKDTKPSKKGLADNNLVCVEREHIFIIMKRGPNTKFYDLIPNFDETSEVFHGMGNASSARNISNNHCFLDASCNGPDVNYNRDANTVDEILMVDDSNEDGYEDQDNPDMNYVNLVFYGDTAGGGDDQDPGEMSGQVDAAGRGGDERDPGERSDPVDTAGRGGDYQDPGERSAPVDTAGCRGDDRDPGERSAPVDTAGHGGDDGDPGDSTLGREENSQGQSNDASNGGDGSGDNAHNDSELVDRERNSPVQPGDPSDPGGSDEPGDDPSDPSDNGSDTASGTTFGTLPPHVRKNTNIYLHPEKTSDETMHALIHASKKQFLNFVYSIDPNQYYVKSPLSKFSQAFLFRLKLASNWSFDELAEVFIISSKTARRIFWHLVEKMYQHTLALPNLVDQTEIEDFFQALFEAEDPYYKQIFSSFKDPTGNVFLAG